MRRTSVALWVGIGLIGLAAAMEGCASATREAPPRATSQLEQSPSGAPPTPDAQTIDQLELQGLVMDMADEYMTGLGEALFQAIDDRNRTPRQRRFAASILRSGALAAIEIGSSPNPDTALLDLLVLVSLQRSAIERLWIPQEWPDIETEPTVARLQRIENELWDEASVVLSDAQKDTLRTLIDYWIAEHPDRRFVELVRFRDFQKTRNMPDLAQREHAQGLLREISQAVETIDEVRLVAERGLWLSIRLPALVGAQVEKTAFHLASEPEVTEMRAQIEAFRQYAERATEQVESLPAVVSDSIEELSGAIAAEREALIANTFDRFSEERTATLDELERRSDTLQGILVELQETIAITSELASSIGNTVETVDRVVARFDREGRDREPLDMENVRLAAEAIGDAADRLTVTLEQASQALGRVNLKESVAQLTDVTDRIVAQAFWRSMGVVAFLLVGLALLKLVPARAAKQTR